MDQERNRRFSTGQMKIASKTCLVRGLEVDNRSDGNDVSTAMSQFRSQERPVARVTESDVQAKYGPEDLNVGLNSGLSLISKSSPMKSVTKRHIPIKGFVRGSRLNERTFIIDTGAGTAEKRRLTPEKNSKEQGCWNEKFSISSRRMSCPDSSLKERFGAVSRTSNAKETAMSKRKLQLTLHMKNNLSAEADKSRDSLPKIIEPLGSLKTDENQALLRIERNFKIKTQNSPSPRTFFDLEKSTDGGHLGVLGSKLSDISTLPSESEGNSRGMKQTSNDKNKVIEITLNNKQHDIVPSRSFNLSSPSNVDDSSRKIKQSMDIHLLRLSVGQEEMTKRSGSRRQVTQRKGKTSSGRRRVNFTPKSMNGEASREINSAKTLELDIDRKVRAFLKSQQPRASPETLKVKVSGKANSFFPNYSVQERMIEPRVFINTDTCPSTSNLINQDRSWYYQDRTGKCRYLRVPESPVPPVEWVFQFKDEKEEGSV